MQVDDQIEVFPAHAEDESEEAPEMIILAFLVDQQAFINILIMFHQIPQFLIGQQADAGLRIVGPQGPQYRRGQHKVTDMHEIDDENILIQGYFSSVPFSSIHQDTVRILVSRASSFCRSAVLSAPVMPGSISVSLPSTRPMTLSVNQ